MSGILHSCRQTLGNLGKAVTDTVFPRRCQGCGESITTNENGEKVHYMKKRYPNGRVVKVKHIGEPSDEAKRDFARGFHKIMERIDRDNTINNEGAA